MISFFLHGEPQPKGSVQGFLRGDKVIVTHTAKSKVWEESIRWQVKDYQHNLDGPLAVSLDFYLTRGKSVKRQYPAVTPDIDKLTRAVLDALKGVIADDARITDLHVTKRYATGGPGVQVIISSD